MAKVVQVFSLRAASMRRMIRSWELAMWTGDEPRAQRELLDLAIAVADANQWARLHRLAGLPGGLVAVAG